MAERNKFFLSIQYFRAFAAMLVVFHHSRLPIRSFFDPLEGFGYAAVAVDIFFLISGVVMYTSARSEAPAEFVRRRLIRIIPLYWLMTLLYLLFTSVLFHTDYTVRRVVLSLLFIPHATEPGGSLGFPVLDVGWTLDAEMFFYAFFLVGLYFRRPVLIPTIVIALVVLAGLLFQPTNPQLIFYSQTVMLDFVIGLFIGMAMDKRNLSRLWPALPIGVVWLIVMATIDPRLTTPPFIHFAIPAILLVVGAIAIEQQGRLPQSQFLKNLGDASYSLYLSHVFLVQILFHIFSRLPLQGWLQYGSFLVTLIGASIIVAFVLYRRVERPMTRFLNQKTRSWTEHQTARPTPAPAQMHEQRQRL